MRTLSLKVLGGVISVLSVAILAGAGQAQTEKTVRSSAVKGEGPVGHVQGHVVCVDLDLHRREVGLQARLLDGEGACGVS